MSGSIIERRELAALTLLDTIRELRNMIVPEGIIEFGYGRLKVSGADWYYILNAAEDKLTKETA